MNDGGESTSLRTTRCGIQSRPCCDSPPTFSGLTKPTSLEGHQYDIACGQIDIGDTTTALAMPMTRGTLQAELSVKPEPTFDVQQVADAVVYMASLPPDANVLLMTVMATKTPFVGRG